MWIFYQEATDEIDKFQNCWEMVLQELHQLKGTSQATPMLCEDLAFKMTGLWSMVVFNRPLECKGK